MFFFFLGGGGDMLLLSVCGTAGFSINDHLLGIWIILLWGN